MTQTLSVYLDNLIVLLFLFPVHSDKIKYHLFVPHTIHDFDHCAFIKIATLAAEITHEIVDTSLHNSAHLTGMPLRQPYFVNNHWHFAL